jgi:2-C-methyl-D-erythritol 4-phosphate cytidylyltransferase
MNDTFSVVFLAGGIGTRMGNDIPKQYLPIRGKPLAMHSFDVFIGMPELAEIVVVCEPDYQYLFLPYQDQVNLKFALPGKRRQDSVFNGIQCLKNNPLVCIHDAARPIINESLVRKTVQAAQKWGAAVLGVKVKATIKICDEDQMIVETPKRDLVWEMQTPQVVRLNLLQEGFKEAELCHFTVTDDVSLVELIGKPVKVVESHYTNIKVTTPDDLITAEHFLDHHALL